MTGKSGGVSLRITMSTSNHRYTLRYTHRQTQVPRHLDVRLDHQWKLLRSLHSWCTHWSLCNQSHPLGSIGSQTDPLGSLGVSTQPQGRSQMELKFHSSATVCSLIVGLAFLTLMGTRRQPRNFECLPAFHVYQLELLYSFGPHL